MPQPTGILIGDKGSTYYYPIPREISYGPPLPWSHVKIAPKQPVELVSLSAAEMAELEPVGFYHGRSEYYVISHEAVLRHLQLVAKALAKHVVTINDYLAGPGEAS